MTDVKRKLPETITVEKEMGKSRHALTRSLAEANSAYKKLYQMVDLGTIPEPSDCKKEWLTKIIDGKRQAVTKADFLSNSQKAAHLAQWASVEKEALQYIKTIQCFVESMPREQYVFDAGKHAIKIKDIESVLESRCSRRIPDEAEIHLALIDAVKASIKELRNWETSKDLSKFRLEELFTMPTEKFAELWATGDIKVNRTFDHLPYVAMQRELTFNSYL